MASKSLLDAVITLPLAAYHAFPFPNLPQVALGLFTLFKLAIVEDPGWDLVHVRETINLASYFDHLVSKTIHRIIHILCFCVIIPRSCLYLGHHGP